MRLSGPASLTASCALALALAPRPAHTTASAAERDPTEGRLLTRHDGRTIDVPLKRTEVGVRIDGHLADATVVQTFHNPFDEKIEAVYLFPLPTGAGISAMTIETGGRTIAGELQRRGEAKRTYARAKKRGHVAALLTQERPNLFTQHVANIEPGAEVKVEMRYVQPLAYEDGGYELVFPMVAPPRYVPQTANNAGDAEAVQPKVLPPDVRSSHEIDLAVEVDAGVPIEALASPSHRIDVHRDAAALPRARVALAAGDTVPNRDFVLRYRVAGEAPAFAVLAHRGADDEDGSFFLVAQPPAADATPDERVTPREIIFLLDTSSSMAGAPLDKAKELVRRVLGGLRADDTFQIVRFADDTSALGPEMIANKPKNVGYTLDWLDALEAAGGTEMTAGIAAALALPHDPARLRLVVFLSDGYVGNEDEVIAAVDAGRGEARLFAFGVGSATNRYLLDEMTRAGRGDAHYVLPSEDTDEVVTRFYERIDRPVLTDIAIDWNGLPVADVVPAAVPDLFVGQPLVLSGHYAEDARGTITVRGMAAGRAVSFDVPVALPARAERPAVATVWARRRIAELSRTLVREHDEDVVEAITNLALEHDLMTRYTAFVAVDRSQVTGGGDAKRVDVPVEVPRAARAVTLSAGGVGGGFASVGYGSAGGGVAYGAAPTMALKSAPPTYWHSAGGDEPDPDDAAGPDAERPRRDIDTELADAAAVRRKLGTELAPVRRCYEAARERDPDVEGDGRVRVTILRDGTITRAGVEGIDDEALAQCINRAMLRVRLPRRSFGDATLEIAYPLHLRSEP